MERGWAVGVESGVTWVKTDEIVEARPAHAAERLSHLTWKTPAGFAGIRLSYRTLGVLRLNGGVRYLGGAGAGKLVNLDYLDATSDAVTHRSVSPTDLVGVDWQLSNDVMLVETTRGKVFLRSFARVGYRGTYHAWSAHGGEYEYRGRKGRFADDEQLIRYVMLHQVFDVGAFVEVGQTGAGFYGRLGAAVSLLSLADDRDSHLLSDTEYYNTYRLGWHARPQIAVGVRFGGGSAAEAFYEPAWQFPFAETGTKIETARGVYRPEEKPNLLMTLHRTGIRVVWPIGTGLTATAPADHGPPSRGPRGVR